MQLEPSQPLPAWHPVRFYALLAASPSSGCDPGDSVLLGRPTLPMPDPEASALIGGVADCCLLVHDLGLSIRVGEVGARLRPSSVAIAGAGGSCRPVGPLP
jgi:hypothetical protein